MDIIVNIDGTLADCTHRLHFIKGNLKNWPAFFDACGEDKPIWPVLDMVHSLEAYEKNRIIFCSSRPERTRAATCQWLLKHMVIRGINLYMRNDNDFREDSIIKREMLVRIRAHRYNPVLAIDDRKQVVDMWRSEGLICAQVAEGEF